MLSDLLLEILVAVVQTVMPMATAACVYLLIKPRLTKRAAITCFVIGLAYMEAHEVVLPFIIPNLRDPAIPVVYAFTAAFLALSGRVLQRRARSFDRLLVAVFSGATLAGIYIVHTVLVSILMRGELEARQLAHINAIASAPVLNERSLAYCELVNIQCFGLNGPDDPALQRMNPPFPGYIRHIATPARAAVKGGWQLVPPQIGNTSSIIQLPQQTVVVRDFAGTQAIFQTYRILVYWWVFTIIFAWGVTGAVVARYHRKKIFGIRARHIDPEALGSPVAITSRPKEAVQRSGTHAQQDAQQGETATEPVTADQSA